MTWQSGTERAIRQAIEAAAVLTLAAGVWLWSVAGAMRDEWGRRRRGC